MLKRVTGKPLFTTTPIADYGVVGNGFTCALITTGGSVDWLCWPAFDSPSLLGALLDIERGGRFALLPLAPLVRTQPHYCGRSFVMEVDLWTDGAHLRRTEFMVGASLARQALLRRMQVLSGSAEIYLQLDVRPDYGLQAPLPEKTAQGFRIGNYYFTAPAHIAWEQVDGVLAGRVTLAAGEEIVATLATVADSWDFAAELAAALAWWQSGPPIIGRDDSAYGDLIERSVQLIHLLTYRPTGALLAAATTSLPEHIGGERNYDYRYVWLRDMAFVILAMLPRGQFQEATKRLLDWFVMSCVDPRTHVPIMFSIDANGDIGERELPHWQGYRGSRPVRVGNAAVKQFQLDAYGELLIAVKLYAEHVGHIERGWWPLLSRLADDMARCWQQPDAGIWEERAQSRHYLYSKAMAWAGLEAAIDLALRFKLPGDVPLWKNAASAVRVYIDAHYWSADKGAYVSTEQGNAVDASALLLGLYDYLPVNDRRMRSTAEVIERELCGGGLCYRRLEELYPPQAEGSFNLCTLWLVIYWARAGERERAHKLFEGFVAHANAYRLYSEEIDVRSGEFLGNYPQLFVHAAIIVAADTLEQRLFPAPAWRF